MQAEKWFGGACLLTEFKDQLTTFMEGKLQIQTNIKRLCKKILTTTEAVYPVDIYIFQQDDASSYTPTTLITKNNNINVCPDHRIAQILI